MRACLMQFGNDIGDGGADTGNFPQSAVRYDALERLGDGRQALSGAQISF